MLEYLDNSFGVKMNSPNIPISEYFKYHPPVTQERKDAHEAVNNAALELALVVEKYVKDASCKQFAVFAIQQARMFANQGITVDELVANAEKE